MTGPAAAAGIGRRDWAVMALLALPPLLIFGLPALLGRTFYWGDLTYLNHPWRVLPAEMAHRGALPLWNPYVYLGMPLAANMQCAAWYPGSLLFHLFPFVWALRLFHVLHFWLAGALAFLWLRRSGFGRYAAAGAAFACMLCGSAVSRVVFLNHVAILALFPALLLFSRRPALLAVCMTLSFLSGYPIMMLALTGAAWVVSAVPEEGPPSWRPLAVHAKRWAAAGLLSLGLGACLLVPAAELTAKSDRGAGVDEKVALTWSMEPRDAVQFTAPPFVDGERYSPTAYWWRTAYWGLAAVLAAGLGLARLTGPGRACALVYLGAVLLVVLGGTNPVSRWVWLNFWPLRYVRYPGTLSYLAIPVVTLLVAWGLQRRKWAGLAAGLIAAELCFYAWGSQPTVPKEYFTDPGPVVRALRREAGASRYLISPLALHWTRGMGYTHDTAVLDLKHRLYGVSNMPYHLPSVANLGEPLVPKASYGFMDFMFSRKGLDETVKWLGWADVRVVMTRDRFPPGALEYLGDSLWHLYRNPGPASRAVWFDEETGGSIPASLGGPVPELSKGVPLEARRTREDRLSISGEFPSSGWLYVSEPRWSGWRADIARPGASGAAADPLPALGAFQKLRVPAGAWTVRFAYEPWSWRAGLLLSLLFICGLAAYWYNCVRRLRHG